LHIRERHERGDETEREREREHKSFPTTKNQTTFQGYGFFPFRTSQDPQKKTQSCTEHDSSKKLGYDDKNALGREAEKRKKEKKPPSEGLDAHGTNENKRQETRRLDPAILRKLA
jgi:hypothetical protein